MRWPSVRFRCCLDSSAGEQTSDLGGAEPQKDGTVLMTSGCIWTRVHYWSSWAHGPETGDYAVLQSYLLVQCTTLVCSVQLPDTNPRLDPALKILQCYHIISSPMEARLKNIYIGSRTLSQTMPIQCKKDIQFSDVETKCISNVWSHMFLVKTCLWCVGSKKICNIIGLLASYQYITHVGQQNTSMMCY